MRRLALCSAGAVVLCFAVGIVLAEEQNEGQNQGQVRRQNVPPAVKIIPQDTNQRLEPNAQALESRQREIRSKMRERIREKRNERSQMETGGRPGLSRAIDTNVPTRTRSGRKLRDVNMPLEKPIVEANQSHQRLTTIEQQLSQAEAKHRDRLARLNRIRELAQQQGNTDAAAQADKLLQEEQKRYDMIQARMEHRKNRIEEFSKKAAPEKGTKKTGQGRSKDVNQPPTGKK
jgi:DNA repair exonuclease SbcCD ATPase subunit